MSEYQYYEFQAVDHPLTQEQMDVLRSISSRARITSNSFINVYNWGDFKGNPDKLMEKYFDAFLYLTNWGTRQLMFRLPKRLLTPDIVSAYQTEENLSCWTEGNYLILSFYASEIEEAEWTESEGWLPPLLPLRSDLMSGDYRCLYLGWLLAVQQRGIDDGALEPPVPPGLGALNPQLRILASFLRIDLDLITAAAEKSEEKPTFNLSKDENSKWVANLSTTEKNAMLVRFLEGKDIHSAAELRQRVFREIRGNAYSANYSHSVGQRSVGQLVARAQVIAEERRKRKAEQLAREKAKQERIRAEKREKYLASLVGREGGLWTKVNKLIAIKQSKKYDEAVLLLQDLHDLALMTGKSSGFSKRMSDLSREHIKKPGLIKRFRKAKLLE